MLHMDMAAAGTSEAVQVVQSKECLRLQDNNNHEHDERSTKQEPVPSAPCFRSSLDDFHDQFRSKGWNEVGANLLALSCYFSQEHFLYFRPKIDLAGRDGLLLVAVTLLGALTPNHPLIGGIAAFAVAGFYLLWKASLWERAEVLILSNLDRELQRHLVNKLLDLCDTRSLDMYNLNALEKKLSNAHIGPEVYHCIKSYFHEFLKMEE